MNSNFLQSNPRRRSSRRGGIPPGRLPAPPGDARRLAAEVGGTGGPSGIRQGSLRKGKAGPEVERSGEFGQTVTTLIYTRVFFKRKCEITHLPIFEKSYGLVEGQI